MSETIDLGYRARPQFEPFHLRTQRFACLVCHRGAGKTVASIHDLLDAALRCRDERPRFAYLAPQRNQVKAVVWDYVRAAVDPLRPLGVQINESELRAYIPGGWELRLHGADNPDALRGLHLNGVVLDEFADMDPTTWSTVIQPTLSARHGTAIFIGTPRGRNAFYDIWQQAQVDPAWFALMLKASETGIHSEKELEVARSTKTDEQYRQEYECDFEAAVVGTYYGKAMAEAERDKRVCGVPYDPAVRVWTAWDLGINDPTVIWFIQVVGKEIHVIDYHSEADVDLGSHVRAINSRSNYVYAGHILPHDVKARELIAGKSRFAALESLGLKNIIVCPDHEVEDGISQTRLFLPRCWFDAKKCEGGINALKLYRSAYDTKLQTMRPRPVHDWASHAADAFRYLVMGLDVTDRSGFGRNINYPNLGWQ